MAELCTNLVVELSQVSQRFEVFGLQNEQSRVSLQVEQILVSLQVELRPVSERVELVLLQLVGGLGPAVTVTVVFLTL